MTGPGDVCGLSKIRLCGIMQAVQKTENTPDFGRLACFLPFCGCITTGVVRPAFA